MKQNRNKDENSDFEVDQKSGCNLDTVEECVNPKSTDSSVGGRGAHEGLRMSFSAEMEVRREGVLEELDR